MSIINQSKKTRTRSVAALMALALGAGALVSVASPVSATAAGLNAVQYNYSIPFTSSQTSTTKTITPVTPAKMVLVIQNISIYRYPASSSTLQSFVGLGGGFIALPDITGITGGGDFYPAGTANLTGYVAAGQSAYVNMYRTGASLPAETAYITVTGYLTAN
jgi:hypothetical protein